MKKRRFKPDPIFHCLFDGRDLVAAFASSGLAERFADSAGLRYTTRQMTLRELANIEEAQRIGIKMRDAVRLGSRGGLKGGKIRAALLSPERRREIAKIAAQTRWANRPTVLLTPTPEL